MKWCKHVRSDESKIHFAVACCQMFDEAIMSALMARMCFPLLARSALLPLGERRRYEPNTAASADGPIRFEASSCAILRVSDNVDSETA